MLQIIQTTLIYVVLIQGDEPIAPSSLKESYLKLMQFQKVIFICKTLLTLYITLLIINQI